MPVFGIVSVPTVNAILSPTLLVTLTLCFCTGLSVGSVGSTGLSVGSVGSTGLSVGSVSGLVNVTLPLKRIAVPVVIFEIVTLHTPSAIAGSLMSIFPCTAEGELTVTIADLLLIALFVVTLPDTTFAVIEAAEIPLLATLLSSVITALPVAFFFTSVTLAFLISE